jgi:hypothetical protein
MDDFRSTLSLSNFHVNTGLIQTLIERRDSLPQMTVILLISKSNTLSDRFSHSLKVGGVM